MDWKFTSAIGVDVWLELHSMYQKEERSVIVRASEIVYIADVGGTFLDKDSAYAGAQTMLVLRHTDDRLYCTECCNAILNAIVGTKK